MSSNDIVFQILLCIALNAAVFKVGVTTLSGFAQFLFRRHFYALVIQILSKTELKGLFISSFWNVVLNIFLWVLRLVNLTQNVFSLYHFRLALWTIMTLPFAALWILCAIHFRKYLTWNVSLKLTNSTRYAPRLS